MGLSRRINADGSPEWKFSPRAGLCTEKLRADLDGTTFAYDCRMRLLWRALLDRVKQRSYTTRHSNILIVAMNDIGQNMFQNPTTFFVLCATVGKMLYA